MANMGHWNGDSLESQNAMGCAFTAGQSGCVSWYFQMAEVPICHDHDNLAKWKHAASYTNSSSMLTDGYATWRKHMCMPPKFEQLLIELLRTSKNQPNMG